MQYGFVIPGGDARICAEFAYEAEKAGWDGVFIPDGICIIDNGTPLPGYDPWVVLTAMAMRTERVRIGPMVTAPSRRRPWKLAREAATLDQLSNGRLILQVGLGALDDAGFGRVGEATDRKTRAQLLDEGLAILDGLWSGKPFSFNGEHYHVQEMTFLPPPVQQPRIPIWVVGLWPKMKPMQRAIRWDGLITAKTNEEGPFAEITPADIEAIKAFVAEQRSSTRPFDIVIEGTTPGDDRKKAVAKLYPFIEAGITWWMETMWFGPNEPDDVRKRIRQGPPRVV